MQEYINIYSNDVQGALQKLDAEAFSRAIDTLVDAYKHDRQIFIFGNGGSAGTANHFVCDFGKNAVVEPGRRRFRILSLSDNIEKITALGNDIAFNEIFRQQLVNLMRDGDVIISVSASGNSPDIVKACEYARSRNGKIISLAGFSGGAMAEIADISLVAPLTSYEQIEDLHMVILHMIVYYFKSHPEALD